MGHGMDDPFAGKSQALKVALAAVERMNGAAAYHASSNGNVTAANLAPKPVMPHPPGRKLLIRRGVRIPSLGSLTSSS